MPDIIDQLNADIADHDRRIANKRRMRGDVRFVRVHRRRDPRASEEIDEECWELVLAEIENRRRGAQTAEETLTYLAETTSRWLHEHYLPRLPPTAT